MNLLPRRFRFSVAPLPAVRVGLSSNTPAELVERCPDVLTPMLTTGLNDPGRAWNQRPPGRPPSWGRGPAWTTVDDARLTRNTSLMAS